MGRSAQKLPIECFFLISITSIGTLHVCVCSLEYQMSTWRTHADNDFGSSQPSLQPILSKLVFFCQE
ncbi:hypothetical protein OBBRIDRAFT_509113 [Obba rivulosa]|uniref:Uncharacterized protein n=1 Tax=Obba rivulosa TaxID=1052685 RepID=A0A8E2B3R8_9APHY|nr:hypothetical protein OBBRIDRAFT_509113 [Obba rivulosa]